MIDGCTQQPSDLHNIEQQQSEILNNNNHLCAVFGKARHLLHNADLEISWEFDHIWYFCNDSDDDGIMLITMAFSFHMLTAQAPYNLSHLEQVSSSYIKPLR